MSDFESKFKQVLKQIKSFKHTIVNGDYHSIYRNGKFLKYEEYKQDIYINYEFRFKRFGHTIYINPIRHYSF